MGCGLQPEGHRTVIDQRHLHVRAEDTRCHRPVRSLCPLEQMAEEPAGILRRGCRAEARSRTFLGVSSKRELGDQQQAALNVAQGKIHPSVLVGEDAVGQHALEEAIRREGVVSTADADERQHSAVYGADGLGIDLYVCPGNALNQGNHGTTMEVAPLVVAFAGARP